MRHAFSKYGGNLGADGFLEAQRRIPNSLKLTPAERAQRVGGGAEEGVAPAGRRGSGIRNHTSTATTAAGRTGIRNAGVRTGRIRAARLWVVTATTGIAVGSAGRSAVPRSIVREAKWERPGSAGGNTFDENDHRISANRKNHE